MEFKVRRASGDWDDVHIVELGSLKALLEFIKLCEHDIILDKDGQITVHDDWVV